MSNFEIIVVILLSIICLPIIIFFIYFMFKLFKVHFEQIQVFFSLIFLILFFIYIVPPVYSKYIYPALNNYLLDDLKKISTFSNYILKKTYIKSFKIRNDGLKHCFQDKNNFYTQQKITKIDGLTKTVPVKQVSIQSCKDNFIFFIDTRSILNINKKKIKNLNIFLTLYRCSDSERSDCSILISDKFILKNEYENFYSSFLDIDLSSYFYDNFSHLIYNFEIVDFSTKNIIN